MSCRGIKYESETFKQLIGGSTASNACSMQGGIKIKYMVFHNGKIFLIYV